MKVIGAIFALFLSFIFIATSFSASPETMLIGKWKGTKSGEIEFAKDGILIIDNQGARYRIIDKERVEFDMGERGRLSELGPRPIFRFTVSEDELILTPLARPNETFKFRRVKMDASGRVKVDASGNDANEYFNRGNKNFAQGNYEQAIKDYDKAIELGQEAAGAYAYRGKAHEKLGNYQQAIKDYERVIGIYPDLEHPYFEIARCYSIQNNAAMACQWLKKVIEKGYKD